MLIDAVVYIPGHGKYLKIQGGTVLTHDLILTAYIWAVVRVFTASPTRNGGFSSSTVALGKKSLQFTVL